MLFASSSTPSPLATNGTPTRTPRDHPGGGGGTGGGPAQSLQKSCDAAARAGGGGGGAQQADLGLLVDGDEVPRASLLSIVSDYLSTQHSLCRCYYKFL